MYIIYVNMYICISIHMNICLSKYITVLGHALYLESVELDGKLLDGMKDHTHIPEDQIGGRAAGTHLIPNASPLVLRLCWPCREAVRL